MTHKYWIARFILKEQSGLYVTGLSPHTQMLFFSIRKRWFLSNDGWSDGLLSGLPAHWNVRISPPSFLSTSLNRSFTPQPFCPYYRCSHVWHRSGHILMPWPPSRTNMHFAPEFVCMCVCVLLAQLAGHSLLIIMFFRIKTCFVFCCNNYVGPWQLSRNHRPACF